MLSLLLILYIPTISAVVTLYQLPYYKGQSLTLNQNDTFIQDIRWQLMAIQSIKISQNESFITYDKDNFQGNNATWYRSVIYPGNWKDRIRSFRIVPVISPPIDPEKQNSIQAPWYFMGTWEGFMMVRMSAQWPGYPECYAVNGVNCILRWEVDEMLSVVEEFANNDKQNSNISSTTFNAPCGPARYEHWGADPLWCNKAQYLLRALANGERNLNDLKCVAKNNGIIAQFQSASLCIPRTDTTYWYACKIFTSMDLCKATVTKFLFTSPYMTDSVKCCGYNDDCSYRSSDDSSSGVKQGNIFWFELC
ncbi:hypothetical protein THRCLA_21904 [Thraustotheca clavata]|uniref:Secreted protein n=1 Tax=Thraustotheca clavata TaxID=74557 RepID=A0A1V9ZJS2_9STRA|nr:hypothetical protein THRCLA_21904 [Thraustotheca clavata]